MLILLNGTSSAGKSSILTHLQRLIAAPCLNAGIDTFLFMLPERYLQPPLWNEVLGEAERAGAVGQVLFSGMHHSLAALVQRGNTVIADHVLVDPAWTAECAALFADLPAYLIGVYCPLEVVEQRERDRGDRTLGQARRQFARVHMHATYDFSVDTSLADAESCAKAIAAYVTSGVQPRAFQELRRNATAARRGSCPQSRPGSDHHKCAAAGE
jgi:chloramphenicol 3-O-phosphotransferase